MRVPRAEDGDKWSQGSDCEDYLIRKRHALIGKRRSAGALRYAKGTVRGVYHVVLIVCTTRGDLVLDNMTPDVLFCALRRQRGDAAVGTGDDQRRAGDEYKLWRFFNTVEEREKWMD